MDAVKLAVIAIVCALFTATLVIGIGGAVLRSDQTPARHDGGGQQSSMTAELY
ncbi:hypothetical protein QOZ96_001197 [Brevundimonas nasdae]|nr:hypothetical protein [Brevundimonas nasdae]